MLDGHTLLATERVQKTKEALVARLQKFHSQRPLRRGIPKEQLRAAVAPDLPQGMFEGLLQHFSKEGAIALDREAVRLPTHEIRLNEEQQRWAQRMERRAKEAGFAPPELDELLAEFPDREQASDLLTVLFEQGILMRFAEFVVHPETVERAKQIAKQLGEQHGGFTASQFREAAKTTRRYAVPLLEFLDHLGVTVRRGDLRELRNG